MSSTAAASGPIWSRRRTTVADETPLSEGESVTTANLPSSAGQRRRRAVAAEIAALTTLEASARSEEAAAAVRAAAAALVEVAPRRAPPPGAAGAAPSARSGLLEGGVLLGSVGCCDCFVPASRGWGLGTSWLADVEAVQLLLSVAGAAFSLARLHCQQSPPPSTAAPRVATAALIAMGWCSPGPAASKEALLGRRAIQPAHGDPATNCQAVSANAQRLSRDSQG